MVSKDVRVFLGAPKSWHTLEYMYLICASNVKFSSIIMLRYFNSETRSIFSLFMFDFLQSVPLSWHWGNVAEHPAGHWLRSYNTFARWPPCIELNFSVACFEYVVLGYTSWSMMNTKVKIVHQFSVACFVLLRWCKIWKKHVKFLAFQPAVMIDDQSVCQCIQLGLSCLLMWRGSCRWIPDERMSHAFMININ